MRYWSTRRLSSRTGSARGAGAATGWKDGRNSERGAGPGPGDAADRSARSGAAHTGRPQVDQDPVGAWRPEHHYAVDEGPVRASAVATNATLPAHHDRSLKPPVFAMAPVWDPLLETVGRNAWPEIALPAVRG